MARPAPLSIALIRGTVVEARHEVHAVETNQEGTVTWSRGRADMLTTLRSSAKPIQALPLSTLGATPFLDLRDEEIAICCASHIGAPEHTRLVASVLSRSGFDPARLVCGPAGDPPDPLKHGCSGNHACIVTCAHALGVDPAGYHLRSHPAQRVALAALIGLARTSEIGLATDGCGIPTYAMTLAQAATSFAGLVRAGAPWSRIPAAMGTYPHLIGHESWADVRIMHATAGRIVGKTGAEGLLCFGLTGTGRGLAIKVVDGSTRSLGPASVWALRQAGWLEEDDLGHPLLRELAEPIYLGPDGSVIARLAVANS